MFYLLLVFHVILLLRRNKECYTNLNIFSPLLAQVKSRIHYLHQEQPVCVAQVKSRIHYLHQEQPVCVAQVKSRIHYHQDKQPKLMLLPVTLYLMSSLHFYRKIDYYRMKIFVRRLWGKSRYFRSCDLLLHWRKRALRYSKYGFH